jgi:hypothetical protein
MLHPREKDWSLDVITREMNVLREMNIGHTFFRSKFLTDNTKGIFSFTKDFNSVPALIPPMRWEGKQAPTSPRDLQLQRGMTADRLSWQEAKDRSGSDYLTYIIYASQDYPVDCSKAENIIAQRVRKHSMTIPHGGQTLNYAITAVDRYGNESIPVFTIGTSQRPRKMDFRELIIGSRKHKKY